MNNNNKANDDGYNTYLMLHLLDNNAFFTDHTCDEMWEEAKKHINLWADSQYDDADYSLYECIELYVQNLTDNSMYPKEKKQPKKITNDFDNWINKLETVEQEITDWLSGNIEESYDEESNIDSCRSNLQQAIQDIHNHKASNTIAVPTTKCVNAILDYILYSEMGGTYDATDSWHSTYQLLMELRNDKIDPDDLSYVSELKPLH